MGSTQVIRTLEAVQIAAAAPELREMLERVVDAGDLPDYSEISPSPFVAGQNLISNLDRIARDRAADTDFVLTMYLAALVKICQAQQERIEQQDRALDHIVDQILPGIDADIKLLREKVEAKGSRKRQSAASKT
jgi:hypothetical protein